MSIHDAYNRFLKEFGKGKHMVLSTAKGERVSSRMMSVVQMDGAFYFQTDVTFQKYDQLTTNPHAALCIENIQIEGVCEQLGHPADCPAFSVLYREVFPGSYERYSLLKNERVFSLKPLFVERWMYIEGEPHMEVFDFAGQTYRLIPYEGK